MKQMMMVQLLVIQTRVPVPGVNTEGQTVTITPVDLSGNPLYDQTPITIPGVAGYEATVPEIPGYTPVTRHNRADER
jgi:hypothetical protein